MNNAFQVWWAMIWRTVLTSLVVYGLAVFIMMSQQITESDPSSRIVQAIATIVTVVAQIYYLKIALNKQYQGFRVSIVEDSAGT